MRRGWQLAAHIADSFYRGRAEAILLTVAGLLRLDVADRLDGLLALIAGEFERVAARPSDGVHEGRDYRLFPLLLALTSSAVLGRTEELRRRRDWLALAAHELRALDPASRASQALFWVAALRDLGLIARYLPAPAAFVRETIDRYLVDTDGERDVDYLRCTYLIHLAHQLGCPEAIHPRLWQILGRALAQLPGSARRRENPYASGFMVVAYAWSASESGDDAPALDLERALHCIDEDAASVALHLPRLDFALMDAALRLRPGDRS
jgi:hypothetical protein